MFETAEIGRSIDKTEYEGLLPELRTRLLAAQKLAHDRGCAVVVLINGADGAGKGELLNSLCAWMDARFITTQAYAPPTEEESQRPEFSRFWLWLPPRGRVGVFLGSWYTAPILQRVNGETDDDALDAQCVRINAFEQALALDGTVIVKLWLHVSKRDQKRRFKKLEKDKLTRWQVTRTDWAHHRLYDAFVAVSSRMIRQTSTQVAPWHVVESADSRFRNVTAAEHVIRAVTAHVQEPSAERPPPPSVEVPDPTTILDTLDLGLSLSEEQYRAEVERLEGRLHRLGDKLARKGRGAIIVLEGPDASGKGGATRRLTRALDARQYCVIPIAAPTDEERAHHYLWRFWRHIPRVGRFTIYDRSWYGRVLVERVEGFAREEDWRRAYKEINDFEQELTEGNLIVIKFWLHISQDEQLRRFQDREREAFKQFKITAEDYRNRQKANLYESAAAEMIERTSTEYSPWTLVEANDKRHARVKVMQTVCDRLKAAL